jgi:hypothetical protein
LATLPDQAARELRPGRRTRQGRRPAPHSHH